MESEWRASKLAGTDVYNEANEKIGNINEVILYRSMQRPDGRKTESEPDTGAPRA
jgi:sporulation protein YlmC with PRC-barrel domain